MLLYQRILSVNTTFMNGSKYYMKDEVPFQDFPAYTEQSSNKGRGFIILLVIVLLIAAVVGGLYFLGNSKKSESKPVVTKTKPTPTHKPTETPSATASGSITPSGKLTPTPSGTSSKLDRTKLNIAVLNGSGVAGAANKTASELKSLGYTIGATTNADKFTYTGITILVKKSEKDYGDLLKKDLASLGNVTVTVDDTIPTDAQVIIGK